MTTVDIFSGFLGAGKTTLIKKLIRESFKGKKVVLIENEFGEIGIDGSFLKESGIQINELNDGCICCSLVGDFRSALKDVIAQYEPDIVLIEPSGVGKLSDVTRAVEAVADDNLQLRSFVCVADAKKVKMYMKNFGEFYDDQVSHASCIVLSRTKDMDEDKLAAAVALIREKNPNAKIVTTDWDSITGDQILEAMMGEDKFTAELIELAKQHNAEHADEDEDEEHEHHHHHHDHDEDCDCEECRHHHDDDDDDDEDEHEHHHHHHDHDDDDDHDEHEHHHHHHHHHHDGHDADEIFVSWGVETAKKFTESEIRDAVEELDSGIYGAVLRSKGILDCGDKWIEFDMVPGELEIREAKPDVTGKLVVIGSKLDTHKVAELFGL